MAWTSTPSKYEREAVVTYDPSSGAIIPSSPSWRKENFLKTADEDAGLFITSNNVVKKIEEWRVQACKQKAIR